MLDDFQELPGDAPGGDAAPWAAAARDRLEARFLRLAVQAAELLRDHPAARPLLERVQDLFPQDRRLPQALARASG